MNEPKLGQWYRVSHSLERIKHSERRFWATSYPQGKAMLIGVRTLSNGEVSNTMMNGLWYHPKKYFKAYMFVSGIDRKPFFALPQHCEFMSN